MTAKILSQHQKRMPHLHREVTRHGKVIWCARAGGSSRGPRIRLHAEYGTAEFWSEYQAALSSAPRQPLAPHEGTLAWLLERYRETTDWTRLSTATHRQRENIFLHVIETAGKQPFVKITTATIMASRDRRANTPNQARHVLDAMRGLFGWAMKARLVKTDPTIGVDNLPRSKGDGFAPWSEDEVAAYESRWPIGTRQRVWLDVVAYTGLRRGDAVRLGRPHVRNGVATIKTEKTGTEVTLPILSVLDATLKAGPCGDLTFIAGENGRPLTKESFGNLFRKACRAAGLRNRSPHGLRKIAATRAANNGATEQQLMALFGWKDGKMAALYTRAADRRRLSQGAMHMLARTAGEQILPLPSGQTTRT
jgi:integrase